MTTEPCDNCKNTETCSVYSYIQDSKGKASPWTMEAHIRMMSDRVSLISAGSKGDYIKLECEELNPIRRRTDDFSALVNGKCKPKKEHDCKCPPDKSCKSGGSGCGGCS